MPSHARPVKGRIITPSASYTRPSDTTAYASGDLVANSTTAASVTALSFSVVRTGESTAAGMIRRVKMWSSDNDTANASFRIHFYSASPVSTAPTNGDNGAYAMAVSDGNSIYLGAVDVTLDRTVNNSDAFGLGVPNGGAEINFAETAAIYALIEARAAYTPASAEVLTVVPEIHLY